MLEGALILVAGAAAVAAERIKAAIERRPDQTRKELKAELGTSLSVQTLCRALQKLRLGLKKKS